MGTEHTSENGQLSREQEELLSLLLGEAEEEEAGSSSIVYLQPEGDRPPLFLVGVVHFRILAQVLGTKWPLLGLLGKELDEEKEYMKKVEALAASYVSEIRSVRPHGPYYLAGFCFGGLVGYEMARQLEREGESVAFLGLIDVFSPTMPKPTVSGERKTDKLNRHFRRLSFGGLGYLRWWVRKRWRFERRRLVHRVRTLGVRVFDRMKWNLPKGWRDATAFEDTLTAGKAYRPGSFGGKVTLFRCCLDEVRMREAETYGIDPTWGWGSLVEGGVELRDVFAGEHLGALKHPHVRTLAAYLLESLESAFQEQASSQPILSSRSVAP